MELHILTNPQNPMSIKIFISYSYLFSQFLIVSEELKKRAHSVVIASAARSFHTLNISTQLKMKEHGIRNFHNSRSISVSSIYQTERERRELPFSYTSALTLGRVA